MLINQDRSLLYGLAVLEGASEVSGVPLHPGVIAPFQQLSEKAALASIDLRIASGFRSFERQLSIWNRKVSGELAILGNNGEILDIHQLNEIERVFAILRWSALPGASRHHWGTDIDVFDAQVLSEGYKLQLTQDEACNVFASLHRWLDQQIGQNTACGFFRPYNEDRGGIAPEPWHLSYAPLAIEFQREFSLEGLASIIAQTDIALKETVLDNLQEIYERFIIVPESCYPLQFGEL